jgi:hypothetical protein
MAVEGKFRKDFAMTFGIRLLALPLHLWAVNPGGFSLKTYISIFLLSAFFAVSKISLADHELNPLLLNSGGAASRFEVGPVRDKLHLGNAGALPESRSEWDKMFSTYNAKWDNGRPGVPDINNSLIFYGRMKCVSREEPNDTYHGSLYFYTKTDVEEKQRSLYKDSSIFMNLNASFLPYSENENPFDTLVNETRTEYRGGAVGHRTNNIKDDAIFGEGETRPWFQDKVSRGTDNKLVVKKVKNPVRGKGIHFVNQYFVRMTADHRYISRRVVKTVDETTGKESTRDLLCEQVERKRTPPVEEAMPVPIPFPKPIHIGPIQGSSPTLTEMFDR